MEKFTIVCFDKYNTFCYVVGLFDDQETAQAALAHHLQFDDHAKFARVEPIYKPS